MDYKKLFKELEILEETWENTHMSSNTYKLVKDEIISYYQNIYRNEKEDTND